MKKQVKIVIGVIVVVAILIIGVSFLFPTVFSGLTSGTFGKADKYHKSQMTEADVKLRSEVTSDTAKLKGMIQGLIYFSLFTQDLSYKIDSCVTKFQEHGICSQEGGCASVTVLQDYSDFIKNNNKTLGTTISMLTGFYLKDESDQSADVERNLRDFGNYVSNLTEKDSILEVAMKSMDNFMLTNKTLKARKTELASLKSIRDQLLVKGVQMAAILQDKPLGAALISYALSSQPGLNVLQISSHGLVVGSQAAGSQGSLNVIIPASAQQTVGAIANAGNLENIVVKGVVTLNSGPEINLILQSQQIAAVGSTSKDLGSALIGSIVIYDKGSLQFIVGSVPILQNQLSNAQFNAILCGTQNYGAVAYFSAGALNMVASSYDIKSIVQNQAIGMTLNNISINAISAICAQGGALGSVVPLGSSPIGIVGVLNNQGGTLGVESDR
ncbi:MAG: hypothetical protein WCR01_08710 [Bacteroidota bacterium]